VKPNPDRALELRMVDRSVPGWLKDIWPLLTVIVTAASGIYSTFTPKVPSCAHIFPTARLKFPLRSVILSALRSTFKATITAQVNVSSVVDTTLSMIIIYSASVTQSILSILTVLRWNQFNHCAKQYAIYHQYSCKPIV
jgi:hypothetical protein